jgi:hypothetical protein
MAEDEEVYIIVNHFAILFLPINGYINPCRFLIIWRGAAQFTNG